MSEKKVALFGAGNYGKRALWEFGMDKVVCFIDNSEDKQGTTIEGIPVYSLTSFKEKKIEAQVYISTVNVSPMREQLEAEGITNYKLYLPKVQYYYSPNELVVNTYDYRVEAKNEKMWNDNMAYNQDVQYIRESVDYLKNHQDLFNHIEIETYNRCNGGCSFCPVSVKNETRPETRMDSELFYKIIDDLSSMKYDGKIALFSNNEPFLDERIIDFHKYARKKLPKARFHLFTNGTLLTMDKFLEIIEYLDELIIDNYNQELKLIPNNQKIKQYCEEHKELIGKVTIVLRKPNEILTSRGGDAPNRNDKIVYDGTTCMLPFRQMIVRPDGKVSLCCNDPLGKYTMGDLAKQTIDEVWFGEKFKNVRKKIYLGRENVDKCKYCDTFTIG